MTIAWGSAIVVAIVALVLVLGAPSAASSAALAVAAASFIYIALSDLLPEMMRRSSLAKSLPEVGLVLLGVVIAAVATGSIHAH